MNITEIYNEIYGITFLCLDCRKSALGQAQCAIVAHRAVHEKTGRYMKTTPVDTGLIPMQHQ